MQVQQPFWELGESSTRLKHKELKHNIIFQENEKLNGADKKFIVFKYLNDFLKIYKRRAARYKSMEYLFNINKAPEIKSLNHRLQRTTL